MGENIRFHGQNLSYPLQFFEIFFGVILKAGQADYTDGSAIRSYLVLRITSAFKNQQLGIENRKTQ